jgi:diketogulonate reductase-like aldo/keto reductase
MRYLRADGVKIPRIGLGTWPMKGDGCHKAVSSALEMGYRHIDTAEIYRNEREVGRAVRDSGIPREEIFVTTKVWSNHLSRSELMKSCERSLDRLGTEWIDLYLIHSPSRRVPSEESVAAMNDLQERGSVRHIGVSNFSVAEMKDAERASDSPILTNQIEYHPFKQPRQVLEYCQEQAIPLTAYSPLAQGRVLRESELLEIAEQHGKTPAQVTLRWLIQGSWVVAIPKAASPTHQRENLSIFDFELTEEEMRRINQLGG